MDFTDSSESYQFASKIWVTLSASLLLLNWSQISSIEACSVMKESLFW